MSQMANVPPRAPLDSYGSDASRPSYSQGSPAPFGSSPPQQAGQWVFQPAIARPASSGLRVAVGVLSILHSLWASLLVMSEIFSFPSGVLVGSTVGFLYFLAVVGIVGNLPLGIIILAKHRSRRQAAPSLLLIFTALGFLATALASLGVRMGPGVTILCAPGAAAITTLTIIAMIRATRGL